MGLLAADLVGLWNTVARRDGRRGVVATIAMLSLLGWMSWFLARAVLDRPELLRALFTHGDPLENLLVQGLLWCTIVAGWLGLLLSQRQLFEAPELPLWRSAPIAPWRPALQVLARATFLALLWCSALGLPFVACVLAEREAPPLAWALVLPAALLCTVPVLATLLAAHVVVTWLFAGRVLQIVLAVVSALASFGFSAFLLIGVFAPGAPAERIASAAGDGMARPWMVEVAAKVLASAASSRFDVAAARDGAVWLLASMAAFLVVARLHPAAAERHLAARRPVLRLGRAWPTGVAASIRKKELLQLLQQPGALLGMLVFALLVFALAREQVLVRPMLADPRLPKDVAHCGAMLALWFLAVLLVLYSHLGRLALWDGPQWPLYVAAPCRPGAILRGKLQSVALLLLWPVLLVAAAGIYAFGALPRTVAAFAGIALAGNLVALGVVAVIGTSPWLMRPDEGGQIRQGSRSLAAMFALVFAFMLAVSPGMVAWEYANGLFHTGRAAEATRLLSFAVPAAWAVALPLAALCVWFAARNYASLLRPR